MSTDFVAVEDMEELRELLDELLDIDHGLSNWGVDFLQNLSEWDGCFTERQADTLRTMWEKYC